MSQFIGNSRQFDSLVASMPRGQRMTYHEGLLMRDRQTDDRVHAVAARAWSGMECGALALVQKRLGPGSCAYVAVKL